MEKIIIMGCIGGGQELFLNHLLATRFSNYHTRFKVQLYKEHCRFIANTRNTTLPDEKGNVHDVLDEIIRLNPDVITIFNVGASIKTIKSLLSLSASKAIILVTPYNTELFTELCNFNRSSKPNLTLYLGNLRDSFDSEIDWIRGLLTPFSVFKTKVFERSHLRQLRTFKNHRFLKLKFTKSLNFEYNQLVLGDCSTKYNPCDYVTKYGSYNYLIQGETDTRTQNLREVYEKLESENIMKIYKITFQRKNFIPGANLLIEHILLSDENTVNAAMHAHKYILSRFGLKENDYYILGINEVESDIIPSFSHFKQDKTYTSLIANMSKEEIIFHILTCAADMEMMYEDFALAVKSFNDSDLRGLMREFKGKVYNRAFPDLDYAFHATKFMIRNIEERISDVDKNN